jgi:hypothetical protein
VNSKTTATIALGILLAAAAAAGAEAPPAQLAAKLEAAFSDWTGDKAERLVLIPATGQPFIFSTGDKAHVSLSLGQLLRTLSRRGTKLEEISDVVHSHNDRRGFSQEDLALCRLLRSYGFRGAFRIYYPETRRIRTLEDPGQAAALARK